MFRHDLVSIHELEMYRNSSGGIVVDFCAYISGTWGAAGHRSDLTSCPMCLDMIWFLFMG